MKKFLTWLFYWIGHVTLWPIQWIYYRKKVYYEDKKVTSRKIKGPALVVSNHKGLMDFPMAMFLFPFHKLYCLMSELIYNHGKLLAWLTKIVGGVRVDRVNYDFGFMDKSLQLLDKKKLLIVYPEGKVETSDKMYPFHPSYILIALRSGAPIIPIYTDGKYKFKERCHVVIGKAIYLDDYCTSENPSKEEIDSLNKMIRNKIRELERICKAKVAKDTYNHGIHFKFFFRDLGRLLAFLMNVHFKAKVYNKGKHKKNLKIKGGGVIVANHSSFADPLVLLNVFWRRRIFILTAEIVFDGHSHRSWLLNQLGCVRIDRNINDIDAMQKCLDIVKNGNLLVIFPSGHIDKYGTIDDFKGGAALMAIQANVPIYPLYLGPRTSKIGRNPVWLGEKIDIEKLRSHDRLNKEDLNNISQVLYQEVKRLEAIALDTNSKKEKK
jgi:1-acyl-sn-glycerol-3-phosphate acyltransferase